MSEVPDNAEAEPARPEGPPPVPPPGPISQSVAIGFRTIYIAMALLALLWIGSNFRQIAPDSQAVVLRFGRIVRAQQAGLLVAWPTPIERVLLLPGPDRQLSQEVTVLPPESAAAEALVNSAGAGALPRGVAPYLTGDGNIVLLNATLIYRIDDPVGYTLSQTHVAAALDRLLRAATVRMTAGRNLNDFLVAAVNTPTDGSPAPSTVAMGGEVRSQLLGLVNARLHELAQAGTSLGIEVQRIDMTAWLPPQAKVAFDAVLTATQAADRGVAMARTDAERRRQEADRERDRLLSAAEATAQELVSGAGVDTARILALEHEATPQTRGTILLREYRAGISSIMGRIGSETVIDPQSGVRFVLPGKTK